MRIASGIFDDPLVIDLLREHLAGMYASSPPGAVSALDLSGLKQPSIAFFTAWDDQDLLACGALKQLDATTGELKSMRTTVRHLRRGAGAFTLTGERDRCVAPRRYATPARDKLARS